MQEARSPSQLRSKRPTRDANLSCSASGISKCIGRLTPLASVCPNGLVPGLEGCSRGFLTPVHFPGPWSCSACRADQPSGALQESWAAPCLPAAALAFRPRQRSVQAAPEEASAPPCRGRGCPERPLHGDGQRIGRPLVQYRYRMWPPPQARTTAAPSSPRPPETGYATASGCRCTRFTSSRVMTCAHRRLPLNGRHWPVHPGPVRRAVPGKFRNRRCCQQTGPHPGRSAVTDRRSCARTPLTRPRTLSRSKEAHIVGKAVRTLSRNWQGGWRSRRQAADHARHTQGKRAAPKRRPLLSFTFRPPA